MLKLESLRVSYGAIQAVRDVSLEIRTGEIVTIIGANGAGKSTLLKAVAGLEPAQDGRITFMDRDITQLPAHQRVGLGLALSPEGRGVFADQTVYDNLLLGGYARRKDRDAIAAGVERAMRCSATARTARPAGRHAVRRRAADAGDGAGADVRAAPAVPGRALAGLAPLIVQDIFAAIRQLRDDGLTIVLVEQMANQALGVADRAYVLETGRVTLSGTGAQLLSDPKVRAAYLGSH